YVAEALFAAGVSPLRAAGRVSRERYARIAAGIRAVLARAIASGGTTLRDFISPDGAPGYFEQELSVYGRGGEPCPRCGRPLRHAMVAQRATVWCGTCQRRGPALSSGHRGKAHGRYHRMHPDPDHRP